MPDRAVSAGAGIVLNPLTASQLEVATGPTIRHTLVWNPASALANKYEPNPRPATGYYDYVGPVDPGTVGVTLNAGDAWVKTDAVLTIPVIGVQMLAPIWLHAANLTAVTALTTGQTILEYIGKVQGAPASAEVNFRVTTAAATITWAEVAIFRGAPTSNGAASLTRTGFLDLSTVANTIGIKKVTVPLTGISPGDDLWVAFGSQATTPFQLRGMLADDIQSGVLQTYAGRPSTAALPQATVLASATQAPPWSSVRA